MINQFKKFGVGVKDEKEKIKRTVKKQVLGYITAALGLVAGLAWNEAIKASIEELFPLGKDTLLAKFIYAIAITLFVVIVGIYLAKTFKKEKEEEK